MIPPLMFARFQGVLIKIAEHEPRVHKGLSFTLVPRKIHYPISGVILAEFTRSSCWTAGSVCFSFNDTEALGFTDFPVAPITK